MNSTPVWPYWSLSSSTEAAGVGCDVYLGDIKGFAKGHLRGSNERKVSILCFSPIFSTEWVEYYNILEYTTFVSF